MENATPNVHAELALHSAQMQKRIFTINGRIHTAFSWAPSNATMIEGRDGVILVDTLSTVDLASPVAVQFRSIANKPIRTVIYTHCHADHVSGVKAFISEDDVRDGRVEIIAHESLVSQLVDLNILTPIIARRLMYTFGFQLPLGEEGNVCCGFGPVNLPGKRSFIPPTRTFSDSLDLEIEGVRMQLVHVPSESEDQIVVWLPDDRVLLSADVIQGETFPNVYAIRGTMFRDPMTWVSAIDRLRGFRAETLVPHHGRPVHGAAVVDELLVAHRDAIQYLHDQTVRWMNHGCTPDEIVEKVKMPPHLAHHPWLGEYYGTYKHSIRGIYSGYLGWFEGDAATLDPPPRAIRAARYVELMGGRENVLKAARRALVDADPQWAAEIATWQIRANPEDKDARSIKATAMRRWGLLQKNANWRNWALTSSLELEGKLTPARGLPAGSPDVVREFPSRAILGSLPVRLKSEQTMDRQLTVAFECIDTGERCALEIRHGICQFHDTPPGNSDVTVRFERQLLSDILLQQTNFAEGVKTGSVSLDGDPRVFSEFLDCFEAPPANPAISVR